MNLLKEIMKNVSHPNLEEYDQSVHCPAYSDRIGNFEFLFNLDENKYP